MFVALSTAARERLIPVYLFIYRFIAFLAITGSLLFVLSWVWIMVFFMFNHTWIAPTFLSNTSDKMLQFTAGYQTAYQNVELLKTTKSQAERDVEFTKMNAAALHQLGSESKTYNTNVGRLGVNKTGDISHSNTIVKDLSNLEHQNEVNVKAGLITRNDAVQIASSIQQFRNSITDDEITLHTLRATTSVQTTTLNAQIAQADNDIKTKEEILAAADRSLAVATASLKTLEDSAYFVTFTNQGSNLAFVPYSDRAVAKVGAKVYDCKLEIIWCHEIGTITKVYNDEQVIEFPLFNVKLSRTERGFLVDLNVSDPKGMDSSVLFVGKPLLF